MEATQVKRAVLELLVTRKNLATADAWRVVLNAELLPAEEDDEELQDKNATKSYVPMVLHAVDDIVPHLADYKTFYKNLYGLLKFCEQECSQELMAIVCKWLAGSDSKAPLAVPFRRWLYEYVDIESETMLKADALQWMQAMLLAALKEEDPTLKLGLLRLVDRKVGSMESVVTPRSTPPSLAMRILAFYWQNAGRLSLSTSLCAAKFSGVVATNGVDTDAVLTFMRWAREYEPIFFQNFAELVVEMKTFPRIRHQDLCLPPTITQFIETTSKHHVTILHQLRASQQQVRQAFESKVLHIQVPSTPSIKGAESLDVTISWSREAVAYLAQDLTMLHQHVFPHAWAVYVTIVASLLSAAEETIDLEAAVACIEGLLSVAAIRSDASSLFLLLAAVIDLRLATHPVWLLKSQLFERTVEDLSEQFILETDSTRKWIQQVLLFQLLLECDARLLSTRHDWLRQRLPSSVYRIVRIRLNP